MAEFDGNEPRHTEPTRGPLKKGLRLFNPLAKLFVLFVTQCNKFGMV